MSAPRWSRASLLFLLSLAACRIGPAEEVSAEDLFDSARLADGATQVSFGGEIYQPALSPHTSTDMGSGRFPEDGFRAAAYQRSLRMISPENAWQPITPDRLIAVERPDCYLLGRLEHDESWGDYFFFGGPGRSEACR